MKLVEMIIDKHGYNGYTAHDSGCRAERTMRHMPLNIKH